LFGVAEPLARPEPQRATRKAVRLPPLTRHQRLGLWAQLSDEDAPAPVAEWLLTPAEIYRAAQVAPAGPAAVVETCRRMLHRSPGELFSPLPCPYEWHDIVLTSQVRQHLEELARQARLRWTVYEDWGFARLVPLGKGISALFAGPSGTGKTMAAQVLARELGMELYRVDLAGVMNKYIGETEKRLKQVFDACERANVLLFFDEADALFGQRTQVKDAHDRFANIEIDYLLQRMEQFDGIAILATNRKGDLDQAFLRRIRFVVDFLPPTPPERLALWHKALLPQAPDGTELLDTIDWQLLANKLNMTGADIKAAALGAAFLARGEGGRITMRHILHAAGREMGKHGVLLRPEEWAGML
jgi:SpoVK/Ycf46/Vps4 family AAA+-type ATPase